MPWGGQYNNSVISLPPSAVSTLEKMYYPPDPLATAAVTFPDEAVLAFRQDNATAYSYWADYLVGPGGPYATSLLNVNDLVHPNPRAYYLKGHSEYGLALGCYTEGPHPACSTIYEGGYLAQLGQSSLCLTLLRPANMHSCTRGCSRPRPSMGSV